MIHENFLETIVRHKRKEIRQKKSRQYVSDLKARIMDQPETRSFRAALEQSSSSHRQEIALVGEIKKASPSKGILREDFDPVRIARVYQDYGASAISVLTDQHFFSGGIENLSRVKDATTVPVLRKDFILDESQIYEARAFGADAILLIAGILEKNQGKEFAAMARGLGMDPLIEIHTEKELERCWEWGEIIGINNRDLKTFETDLTTTLRVITEIPDQYLVVSESGIGSRKDVLRVMEAGADAVLVGESLLCSDDMGATIRELLGRP